MSPSHLTQQTRIIDRASRDIRHILHTRLKGGNPLAMSQIDHIARRLKLIHETTLAIQTEIQEEYCQRVRRH